ncbi:MAG: invasion associated locus B family protein [Maritimibacter sp.]
MSRLTLASLALTAVFASTGLITASTSATAQDAEETRVTNGQKFDAWNVACEAIAVNETTCMLNQQLLRAADQAFITQMVAFWDRAGENRYLSVRVPTGVYLPAGFAMRTEESEEITEFTWQTCGRDLCEALIELDDDLIAKVDAETPVTMIASYRPSITAEPVVFRFALTGLNAGLTALKPASE